MMRRQPVTHPSCRRCVMRAGGEEVSSIRAKYFTGREGGGGRGEGGETSACLGWREMTSELENQTSSSEEGTSVGGIFSHADDSRFRMIPRRLALFLLMNKCPGYKMVSMHVSTSRNQISPQHSNRTSWLLLCRFWTLSVRLSTRCPPPYSGESDGPGERAADGCSCTTQIQGIALER